MAQLTKQTSKAAPASMLAMNAAASRQAGRNLASSLLTMQGTTSRSTLRALLASMAPFNIPVGITPMGSGAIPIDNSVNTLIWSVLIPLGCNCLVVCAMASDGVTLSTATYGGVSVPMFQQVQQASGISGHSIGVMQTWQGILINPPTGINNIVLTWNSSSARFVMGGWQAFGGVDPVNPTGPGSVLASSAGNPSFNVTAKRNGCWIVDAVLADLSVSENSPQVFDGGDTESFFFGRLSHNPNVSAGPVSDGYTSGGDAALVAVALNPADDNLIRGTNKYVASSSSLFSAAVSKTAAKGISSVLNSFGTAIARASAKSLASSCASFAGSTVRSAGRPLASAMLSFSAAANRAAGKGLAGSSASFSASQTRSTQKNLQGSAATFAASTSRSFAKTIAAAMQTFAASIAASIVAGTHYAVTLGASMASFVAAASKQSAKSVPSTTAPFAGSSTKTSTKGLAAAISFSGSIAKASARALAAQTAGFSATLGRGARKSLAATQAVFSASISATLQQIQPALDSLAAIAVAAYGTLRSLFVSASAIAPEVVTAEEAELVITASVVKTTMAMLATNVAVRCSMISIAAEVNHV